MTITERQREIMTATLCDVIANKKMPPEMSPDEAKEAVGQLIRAMVTQVSRLNAAITQGIDEVIPRASPTPQALPDLHFLTVIGPTPLRQTVRGDLSPARSLSFSFPKELDRQGEDSRTVELIRSFVDVCSRFEAELVSLHPEARWSVVEAR